MAFTTSITGPLVTKLVNYGALSGAEEAALAGAVSGVREVEPGKDLVVEGASPEYSSLLLSGMSGRYNTSVEGKRQITALHVAGDFVDLHSFLMKPLDHSIMALVPCRMATIPHSALTRITEQYPRLARLLWLNTLIDAGMHRRWEFILGSLQAHQHFSHLICEMYLRLHQIGGTDRGSFSFPVTQLVLSECLALSPVHTNRVVQKMRGENVISWERDVITIKDWARLVEIGEFDPTYLRMPKWAAPATAGPEQ